MYVKFCILHILLLQVGNINLPVHAIPAPSRTCRGPRLNLRRNLGQKCRLCRISLINLPCRLCRSEERLSSQNHRKIVHDNLWQGSGNPHPSYVRENHKKNCWIVFLSIKRHIFRPSFNAAICSVAYEFCPGEKYFWYSLMCHNDQPLLVAALMRCMPGVADNTGPRMKVKY